jgi:hypothetical protein
MYHYHCYSTSRVIDNFPAVVPVDLNARTALIVRDLAFVLEAYIVPGSWRNAREGAVLSSERYGY